MAIKKLSKTFTPKVVTITLRASASLIQRTEAELTARAADDGNKCYGYFPGMENREGIGVDLPVCKEFATQVATIDAGGKLVNFNFLRLSLVDQPSISPVHLDGDSSTALTGDSATLAKRFVWRFLVNLSETKSRTVIYLDLDPSTIELTVDRGYISYPSKSITEDMICSVTLPPRKGNKVSGVLFCASRVLHAGKDMDGGHFVAGYGVDEDAA